MSNAWKVGNKLAGVKTYPLTLPSAEMPFAKYVLCYIFISLNETYYANTNGFRRKYNVNLLHMIRHKSAPPRHF